MACRSSDPAPRFGAAANRAGREGCCVRARKNYCEQRAAASQVCGRRALFLDVHVCCVLAFSRPKATACSHCSAECLFYGSAHACVSHSFDVRKATIMSRALFKHACCMLFRLLVCTLCHWHATTPLPHRICSARAHTTELRPYFSMYGAS